MNATSWRRLALVASLSCALPATGAEEQRALASRLAWLAGCWAYLDADAGSGETWTPPAGGQLLGVARRVSAGRVVSWEYQRIVEEPGGLAFLASPSGAPEVRFPMKSLAANEVVFENLDNDFPQRVIYHLGQSGRISARIEGAKDDPTRAVDLPMKRTSCDEASS
jgi:hypothetical protein